MVKNISKMDVRTIQSNEESKYILDKDIGTAIDVALLEMDFGHRNTRDKAEEYADAIKYKLGLIPHLYKRMGDKKKQEARKNGNKNY